MQPSCIFDSTGGHRADGDRLLLLGYHFAPSTAAGALRWQKLARHLAEAGFGLDVVTRDPTELPVVDPGTLEDLPAGTRVFAVPDPRPAWDRFEDAAWKRIAAVRRARGPQPGAPATAIGPAQPGSLHTRDLPPVWRGRAQWRRAYHAWREISRQQAWARRAGAAAETLLSRQRYRALISCGPPHWIHPAAAALSRRAQLPWVMDLRDPWSFVERLPESVASAYLLRRAAAGEARCVARAALVVMNTEPAAEAMAARYPGAATRIIAVRNGVDAIVAGPDRAPERFEIAYAGSVYLDRDPTELFHAVAQLVRANRIVPDDLRVVFMGDAGRIGGLTLAELAEHTGIGAHFEHRSAGTRAEAGALLAGASVLVNLPQDSHLAIPSKLYEYMQYPAAILALAEPESATGRLLGGTDADVVAPHDRAGMVRALQRQWEAWRRGERRKALGSDPRFGRAAQAQRLIEALERVAPRAVRPAAARGTSTAGAASVAGR